MNLGHFVCNCLHIQNTFIAPTVFIIVIKYESITKALIFGPLNILALFFLSLRLEKVPKSALKKYAFTPTNQRVINDIQTILMAFFFDGINF